MKNLIKLSIFIISLFWIKCSEEWDDKIIFAICADYPPFEYTVDKKLTGFDVELAKYIGKEMRLKVEFKNMQFSTLLVSLRNKMVDAAISTITITENRLKNFDFSKPYYFEKLSIVSLKDNPILKKQDLYSKKIACQIGTTMEIWLRDNFPSGTTIITNDNNPQAIESLKSGHVDAVIIDTIQAIAFVKKNPRLQYCIIDISKNGYGIAFRKNSSLREKVNKSIDALKKKGIIKKLKEKYIQQNYLKL